MIDIDKIEAAAKPVKDWSQSCDQAWLDMSEDESAAVVGHITEEGTEYPVMIVDCDQYMQGDKSMPLAKFYATANPAIVLEMVSMIRERDQIASALADFTCRLGEETAKRKAAQIENEALKGKVAKSGIDQRRAVYEATIERDAVLRQALEALGLARAFAEGGTQKARDAIAAIKGVLEP